MLKVAKNLSFAVNFFKICGLFLESFNEPKQKRLKFIKYCPFGVLTVHAIVALFLTLKMIKMFAFDGE